jgi:hypothetical protein
MPSVIQIGTVVRDLTTTMREYRRVLGWEPWRIFELSPPHHHDSAPTAYSMRTAVTSASGVDVELVEPGPEPSPYREFLERHGEGLHHLMLDGDPERLHLPVLMQGRVGPSAEYVYFDATAALKVTLEAMRGSVEPTRMWPSG